MPVIEVSTKADFDKYIAGPVTVVDFYATWCGPCKVISPRFSDFSNVYTKATFIKVDVDEVPDVAAEVGIRAMPTFYVFVNGQKVAEVVGADPKALEEKIKEFAA